MSLMRLFEIDVATEKIVSRGKGEVRIHLRVSQRKGALKERGRPIAFSGIASGSRPQNESTRNPLPVAEFAELLFRFRRCGAGAFESSAEQMQ
jgi:hypothetical protein